MKIFNVLLICFVLAIGYSYAKFIPIALDEKIANSHLIIEGEVISEDSYFNASETMIFTEYEIKIYKIFKGNINSNIVNLIIQGGQVGNKKIQTCPDESIEIGQYGIFFLIPAGYAVRPDNINDKYELFASLQGFYDIDDNRTVGVLESYQNIQIFYNEMESVIGSPYLEKARKSEKINHKQENNDRILVNITSFSPTTVNAGAGDTLTIRGTNFGATRGSVNFRNADNGGSSYISAPSNSFVLWSDTLIKLKVPAKAGTGTIQVVDNGGSSATTTSSLTVRFAMLNVNNNYYIHLVNYNNNGGYRFTFNNNLYSNQSAVNAFLRALQTWRCGTYVKFDISSNTSSVSCPNGDGVSILSMSTSSCPLSTGILAVTYSYWTGCANSTIWILYEADMILNTNVNWNWGPGTPAGNQSDAESVILHEFGHAHQLGHVIGSNYSMHYAIPYGTTKRALNDWSDVAGGEYVMNYSTPSGRCGYGAMQPLNSSNCQISMLPVADFNASPSSGCGTLIVQFTDQSENNPNQWLWDIDNNGTIDYTTRNPQHTYTQPGNYSVKLIVANNLGRDTIIKTNYIQVFTIPNVDYTGPSAVCNKSSATYSATNPTGFSHRWAAVGGSIQGSSISSNVIVLWDNDGPGTLKLIKTNDTTGCKDSTTKIITINPLPNPNFSGSLIVCSKSIETYTANQTQGVTNQWLVNGGEIIGSSTGNQVTVQWGTNQTGTLRLIQTNNVTYCTDTVRKNISINPLPNPAIEGEFSVCQRSLHKYSAPNIPNYTFQWIATGGAIQGNSSVGIIDVLWGNSNDASLKLIMTNNETGCKDSITELITINSLPEPTISGTNTPCQKKEYFYSSNFHSLLAYNWEIQNGEIIGNNNGGDVKIVWNETGIGKLKLVQRNNSTGCKDSTELIVNIQPNPNPIIIGDTNVCLSEIYYYKAQKQQTIETQWFTSQGSLLDGNKGDSIRIKWMVKGKANLKIVRTNLITGCKDSNQINVNVMDFEKSNISGDSIVCPGEEFEYIVNTSNDYQYFWNVSNGTILENIGNRIKISWNYSDNGRIDVIKTIGSGKCKDTAELSVQIRKKEKISFIQKLEICQNDEPIELEIATPKGGKYSGDGIINNLLNPKVLQPGEYEIEYIYDNLNGCISKAKSSFIILEAPEKPHISIKNDTIISDYKGKNRWYLNNEELITTETNIYNVNITGYYAVEAVSPDGCSSIRSDSIYYIHTFIQNYEAINDFIISPIPADDYIKFKTTNLQLLTTDDIRIYDILGRPMINSKDNIFKIINHSPISHYLQIDISHLTAGVFYLRFNSETRIFIKR